MFDANVIIFAKSSVRWLSPRPEWELTCIAFISIYRACFCVLACVHAVFVLQIMCTPKIYIYSVIGSKREVARAHTQASISFQQYHIFGLHNRWSELKFSVFVLLYTICSLLCARIFAIQSKFSWWKLCVCVCISVCLFSFQLAYNFLRNANN